MNNLGWALNNQTFGIDTIYPKISINYLAQEGFTQYIDFNTTINDTNLNSCYYNVFNLAGGLDSTGSFVCNNITTFAVSSYATYNLTVYANDLANNTAFYNQQFTISSSAPIVQGGGGGGIIINNYPNQTINVSPPRVCISAENAWNKWLDETKGQMLLERIKSGWRILLDLIFCKSSASIQPLDSVYFGG